MEDNYESRDDASVTLEKLRVGKAVVSIRFWRKKDGRSTYRVLDLRGKLHAVRQATP